MSAVPAPPQRLLWAGFGIFVIGRVVDLLWHATHPEFETALDQVQAHTVVWTGGLVILVASAWAVARGSREPGVLLALGGTLLYGPVAVWHFWEHLQLRDPDLPHILLVVSDVVILSAAVVTLLTAWRRVSRR